MSGDSHRYDTAHAEGGGAVPGGLSADAGPTPAAGAGLLACTDDGDDMAG